MGGTGTSGQVRGAESDRGSVLIVDDDRAFRFALRKALGRLGFEVSEAASGEEALEVLRGTRAPTAALLDLRMEGIDGLEVLRRRGITRTRVIMLTGHGTVRATVEAMNLGAFSFVEKPIDAEVLGPLLDQAVADRRREMTGIDGVPPLIGQSSAIDEVRHFVKRVGPTGETVVIYGETGTGKEVLARHIHLASPRRDKPFVALNVACVPENLFEAELFGTKEGAAAGAAEDRPGLFREADGGTLFLDEVAELPFELQAKLHRAIEARRVRSVGDTVETPVDVRIIAASGRQLRKEVQAGRFREDLYLRLAVFPVAIAALRHRPIDILPLAEHLLSRVGATATLDDGAAAALRAHRWPGNVRELLNVLRRAALFAEADVIDGELMGRMIAASIFAQREVASASPAKAPRPASSPPAASASLADMEREHIERVLGDKEGNVTHAATALGIDRRTLQRKLRTYGLGPEE